MGLFRKATHSTFRFVQRATELDHFHLFTEIPMTIALSRLVDWHSLPSRERDSASAFGILHDSYGHGQPLLPVEIDFAFSAVGEGVGWGEVWKDGDSNDTQSYRARIVVFDPGKVLFHTLLKAFEHAAISGNQYIHLVFSRDRSEPYDVQTAEPRRKQQREELIALMRRVDAGKDKLPTIKFDQIAVEDNILLKAASWSHSWSDGLYNRRSYHDAAAAKWRAMPWRKDETAKR